MPIEKFVEIEALISLNEHLIKKEYAMNDKYVEHIRSVLPRDENWR